MQYTRPTNRELSKRIHEAKESLKKKHGVFANPSKVVGELSTLTIGDTSEVWELILDLLEEISPDDYCGSRPPQKSYEIAIEDRELFAFCWESSRLGKKMYLKICFEGWPVLLCVFASKPCFKQNRCRIMKCLNCNGEEFEVKQVRFYPEVKGEEVEVVVPSFVCTTCQETLMDGKQMNTLRKCAADKYRKCHNLLTSEEILKFRTMLGMSQSAFAHYLKVGEASIKRWETYYVQDPVQDDHIRLKCDEAYAELNALEVHWKSHPPDIYNGNRPFCLEIFKQAVCYLIKFTTSPLFLNKSLFYSDFKHFQRYGTGITGARYVHLDYGPCPDQYQNLFQSFLADGVLVSAGHHRLKSVDKANLAVFSDSEREVLEYVASIAEVDGGEKLLKISHEEDAFKKTEPLKGISYEYSKKMMI